MTKKFNVFLWLLLLTGAVLPNPSRAQNYSQSQKANLQNNVVSWDRVGKTDPAKKVKAQPAKTSAGSPTAVRTSEANRQPPGGDGTVWNAIQGRNWQRDYDVQVGDVILLRRSTDEPPPPGTKVVLRWRTPQEYDRTAYSSSKGARNIPRGQFKL